MGETIRTFSELTELLLHICHRVPLRGRLLLRSNIATDTIAAAVLLRRDGCVGTLRVGELAHRLLLLLLLLPLCDLVAGILLLVLEHQLARELLVQLRLFGL